MHNLCICGSDSIIVDVATCLVVLFDIGSN
jgi:hypothetical protein